MTVVSRSALVSYSAAQMFDLVEGVEDYPRFLPWCSATEVSFRDPVVTRATIHINYRGIRQSFSTENHKSPPGRMSLRLLQGPFRKLDGEWRFTALNGNACRVDFSLGYEFSSPLLERLVGPVFAHIAGTMVDAFLKRADKVYGKP
jgi:ribosome-associated toxin RatA of RatAB toxin-antitoxin module